MAIGGHAIDNTSFAKENYQWLIDKIIKSTNASYFGIDLMITDDSYSVIEINARAEWMHHTFSEGKQHNIAIDVLSPLLSKTKTSTLKHQFDLRFHLLLPFLNHFWRDLL